MYRENAAPPARTLTIRPESVGLSRMLFALAGCLVLIGVGAVVLAFFLVWPVVLVAIPHFIVGGVLFDVAMRALRTVVRFEVAHDAIFVTWRRGLRTIKTHRLEPSDIVDVRLERPHPPTSDGATRLVVQTRHGPLPLSEDFDAELSSGSTQGELAAFLGVAAPRLSE